jgi:hypothetical protein
MVEETINGIKYKLPGSYTKKGTVSRGLTQFQKDMYVHLINWKWKNITKDAGINIHKGEEIPYDAILPKSVHHTPPHIYPPVLNEFQNHNNTYKIKLHLHFYHMASSQAANINLFLPILLNPKANEILSQLKPSDFDRLCTDSEYMYKGFRLEYWDGNADNEKGLLGDHNARSGTDSDIAIAYYNKDKERCLWLIEHKLTENEFTECGGFKSEGRNKSKHLCEKSFSEIINDKHICYYHDVRKSEYWNITEEHQSFFANANTRASCPFKGGMNQLWRNQLMGLALEKTGKYKHVYFSVVHHPENDALNESMNEYKQLIANNKKFSHFTSKDVINAADKIGDSAIDEWVSWYKGLYNV